MHKHSVNELTLGSSTHRRPPRRCPGGRSQYSQASVVGGVASSRAAPWWATAQVAHPSRAPCRARARWQGRSSRVGWRPRAARRQWRCGSSAPHATQAFRPVPVGRSEGAVMSICMQGPPARQACVSCSTERVPTPAQRASRAVVWAPQRRASKARVHRRILAACAAARGRGGGRGGAPW